MSYLKVWSYISAAASFILTFILATGCILICLWYDDPQKLDTSYKYRETPYWIWVLSSIFFVFALLSTMALIRGIIKEMPSLFTPYFSNMTLLMYFTIVRAFITMIRQIIDKYPAGNVAAEFFGELAFAGFIFAIMFPCFMLYKKLAGYSYFDHMLLCCFGCKYCRVKRSSEGVTSYNI